MTTHAATRATMNPPRSRPPEPASELVADDETHAVPRAQAATERTDTVKDSLGRKLKLRELSLLDEVDLIASMPPAHAAQPMVLGRAMLAARVASIDDAAMQVPLTPVQYRAMMARVGRDGIVAVIAATMPGDEGEPEQNAETELAKN